MGEISSALNTQNYIIRHGYREHPRAGGTNDVEAIIAFFHMIAGG